MFKLYCYKISKTLNMKSAYLKEKAKKYSYLQKLLGYHANRFFYTSILLVLLSLTYVLYTVTLSHSNGVFFYILNKINMQHVLSCYTPFFFLFKGHFVVSVIVSKSSWQQVHWTNLDCEFLHVVLWLWCFSNTFLIRLRNMVQG